MNHGCIFYGNTTVPSHLTENLTSTLRNLIEQLSIDTFYVTGKDDFNILAQQTLRQLRNEYPHIRCFTISLPISSSLLSRLLLCLADCAVTCIRQADDDAVRFSSLAHRHRKILFPL